MFFFLIQKPSRILKNFYVTNNTEKDNLTNSTPQMQPNHKIHAELESCAIFEGSKPTNAIRLQSH